MITYRVVRMERFVVIRHEELRNLDDSVSQVTREVGEFVDERDAQEVAESLTSRASLIPKVM